jgi:hypothetical protein
MGRKGYRRTPDDDPRHLYHNVLVALVAKRRLNNGQPSFLAGLMRAARIAQAEHVVHLGCGVGYYSAVGRRGSSRAAPQRSSPSSANASSRTRSQARR